MHLAKSAKLFRSVICDPHHWSSFIFRIFFDFISLQVTQFLHGESYIVWGGTDGYQTLMNTDMSGAYFADYFMAPPICSFPSDPNFLQANVDYSVGCLAFLMARCI